MSSKKGTINITKILKQYSNGVLESYQLAMLESLNDGVDQLQNANVDFHLGETGRAYLQGWSSKETYTKNTGRFKGIIYNRTHWGLAHLLENKHITRDGETYSKAFPHIKPVRDEIANRIESRIAEQLEGVK